LFINLWNYTTVYLGANNKINNNNNNNNNLKAAIRLLVSDDTPAMPSAEVLSKLIRWVSGDYPPEAEGFCANRSLFCILGQFEEVLFLKTFVRKFIRKIDFTATV